MKGLNIVAAVLALWAGLVQAANFTVSDIRIEGLQQVEPGIVFRNFPISRGNQVDDQRLNDATRDLFETGYFDDVQLLRDEGDVLVLRLVERPSISIIRIEGNDFIKEEQLREALKRGGVEEGDIFRRSSLELIRLELLKVYNEAGRYTASIETEVAEGEGNRVAVDVTIKEGRVAVVKQINIVGNQAFDDETLLELFDSGLTNMWSWWTDNDKYAREKVSADIERLKSWYLDRGYAQFEINSTDVSVSPDQQQVYINISLSEGPLFTFRSVEIVGKTPERLAGVEDRLEILSGDVYSQSAVVAAQQQITDEMGESGYFYARVSPLPEFSDDETIALSFFVEPGKLTYIRRIQISGNSTTADEVIRREIPQMEGSLFNSDLVRKARQKVDRLGFFKNVTIETNSVAGSDDQVDLQINVEEQLLGQLTAGVGVSDSEGVGFQFGLQQDNFLGTGNRLGFEVNTSSVQTTYSASFFDPYYTLDGVSRGYNFYYRTRDFQENDISDYNTNEVGSNIEFGYPLNETDRIRITLGADLTEVQLRTNTGSTVVERFVGNNALSEEYLTYELGMGWNSNSLNSGFFPTKGQSQDVSVSVALPGGDLSYYKAEYRGRYYRPLSKNEQWVLGFRTYGGYSDTLDSKDYPFYKNFFAGGRRTVRGFANNSLGPRETNGDVVGGNILLSVTSELVVPTPFAGDANQWRTSLFVDAGNVYRTDCEGLIECTEGFDAGDLRASTGVALGWLTPIGPLAISYGKALNAKSGDVEEQVQFVIGSTF